jgi:hypothetical protein
MAKIYTSNPLQNLAKATTSPHTEPMKNRRQGAYVAALSPALWLLVACLVVLVGPDVWAQGAAQAQQSLGFPYLDPDPNRAKMLANAFVAQMGLFLGGVGGIPALTMLGAIAALIGGMSILFFRQFQPTIIAGWLLMVTIVIFVPLNSRLLFNPITVAEPQNVTSSSRGGSSPSGNQNPPSGTGTVVAHNGNPCPSNPRGCGFTPQLAAVHVTSIIQMVLSDLFRSTGWRGLMERQVADSMLRTRPELKLSEAWLLQNQRFVNQCSGQVTLGELIAGITPNNAGVVTSRNQGSPHRFGELWKRWGEEFANNSEHNKRPFIALLPSTLEQAQQYGWGSDTNNEFYRAYEKALSDIRKEFVKTDKKNVSFNPSGDQVSVAQALADLASAKFLEVNANTPLSGLREVNSISVNPGFFMTPFNLRDSRNSQAIWARSCYINDEAPAGTWGETVVRGLRAVGATAAGNGIISDNYSRTACLNAAAGAFSANIPLISAAYTTLSGLVGLVQAATVGGTRVGGELGNSNLIWGTPNNQWETYRFINQYTSGLTQEQATMTKPWQAFIRHFSIIEQMPVIYGDANLAPLNYENSNKGFPFVPFTPLVRQGCKELGQELLADAIKQFKPKRQGGVQPDDLLNGYLAMLTGDKQLSQDNITVDDLLQGTSNQAGDLRFNNNSRYTLLKMLADDANNTLLELGARGQSPQVKQAALINRYVKLAQDVTAQAFPTVARNSVALYAAQDGRTINSNLIGNTTVTETVGNAFFWVGEKVYAFISFFVGPVALGTIMFLNVFIDLAVFGIIVITPFLLIAGMLQPRKALGYLVISVMAVFVLKFVPISLIILNSIAGMVYELLPSALGINASLAQSMMILGLASIYTGLVGFTLYLLFKSGDPASTIGSLANLDNAAKMLPEALKKAAIGLATLAAGSLVLGPLAGMVGEASRRLGRKKKPGDGKGTQTSTEGDGGGGGSDGKGGGGGQMTQPRAAETDLPGSVGETLGDMTAENAKIAGDALGGRFNHEDILDRVSRTDANGDRVPSGEFRETYIDQNGTERTATFKMGQNGELLARISPPLDPDTRTPGSLNESTENQPDSAAGDTPVPDSDKDVNADNVNISGNKNDLEKELKTADNQQKRVEQPTGGTSPAASAADPARPVAGKVAEQPKTYTQEQLKTAQKVGQQSADLPTSNTQQEAALKALNAFNANIDEQIASLPFNTSLTPEKRAALANNLQKMKEEAKKNYEEFNQVAGDLGGFLNTLSQTNEVGNARIGADKDPSLWKVAASGFIGGFKAFGGGAASIPIIGNLIRGTIDEYYEAPERAKAWQAAGGFMKHWKAGGDAQRLKYYQQEIAPLTPGFQYQQMGQLGTFQAQVDLNLNAAAQSVARTRSEFEALLQQKINETKGSNISLNSLTVADIEAGKAKILFDAADYKGIGMVDAAQKLGTIRAEVAAMQQQSIKLSVPDGEGKLKDIVVQPNAAMFQRIYGDLGKNVAKYFDQAVLDWYGVVEKQTGRGKDEWNATQNMAYDHKAMAKFMAQDISTDYLITGHYKMVTGKDQFMTMRGQVLEMIKSRNTDAWEETTRLNDFVKNKHGNNRQNALIEAIQVVEGPGANLQDIKIKYMQKNPTATQAQFEREMLNKWLAHEKGGNHKSQMAQMADEAMARGAATWSKRLNRAINAEFQEQIDIQEQVIKDIGKKAGQYGANVYKKVLAPNSKKPLTHDGAHEELFERLRKPVFKALGKDIKRSLAENVKIMNKVVGGVMEELAEDLTGYYAGDFKDSKGKLKAGITFEPAKMEKFIQAVKAKFNESGVRMESGMEDALNELDKLKSLKKTKDGKLILDETSYDD